MRTACSIIALLAAAPAFADEAGEATHSDATGGAPELRLGEPIDRARSGRFQILAGYGTDQGFIAGATLAQDDLFGTGQRLRLSADVSAVHQRALMSYELPNLLDSGFDVRADLFAARRAYSGFTRDGAGGALTVGMRVSPTTRIYARYRIERVAIDPTGIDPTAIDSAAISAPAPGASLGEGLLATIGGGLEHSTLDASFLPRRGSRFELFADSASRDFGSDYELWRAGIVVDHARPVGPFTLRLHGRATYVHSNDPMGVPLAFRLHHEGHAGVRGYGLETGSLGGENLEAIGRAELELPILRRAGLSVAGFADAGLRYNADGAWGARGGLLQRSVGLSLIWRSPIGPLRFDFALPLDGARRELQFLLGAGAL